MLRIQRFCTKLRPQGKQRSVQVLLESTKKDFGNCALNLNKKADISLFLRKREEGYTCISSLVFLEFTIAYTKANTFVKILKLNGNILFVCY